MNLLVGCPISHRAWALPQWFRYLRDAAAVAGVNCEVLFVGDEIRDADTALAARWLSWVHSMPVSWCSVVDPRPVDERSWNFARYHRMVELRNILLYQVRQVAPDAFLSLDSDILVHPQALQHLISHLTADNAVGGKVYLSEYGTDCPSWANLGREGTLQRADSSGTFAVDVIMAIKLMSPKAYHVDYRMDVQGEDIGWSKAATEAGVPLWWDGRVTSKHMFTPRHVDVIDSRVGY